ncbi:MAG: radical SAM protein [Nanoarchaeota archaeon]
MVVISIITPPKVEPTFQLSAPDSDIYLGPIVLEQSLRNHGFEDVANYDLSRNGKFAMIREYDRTPDFEQQLFGIADAEVCVAEAASRIRDSDLYLISMHLANHTSGMKLAERLKREHLGGQRKNAGYMVVGGPSIAETTERILAVSEIDAACYGYGEETAPHLAHFVRSAAYGNVPLHTLSVVPNLYVRGERGEFVRTPFVLPGEIVTPSLALLEHTVREIHAERLPIVGAYGCEWGRCNYCYLSSKPQHYRPKPIQEIVDEVDRGARIEGIQTISILDEAFLHRADDFREAFGGRNLPARFDFDARPNHVLQHGESLERLIRAFSGTTFIAYVGAESFDPEVLNSFHRGVSVEQTTAATERLVALDDKYENFDFQTAFFLWAVGQTRQGLYRGVNLWEKATRGRVTPADLLKIQRFNIYTSPLTTSETRNAFDHEMDEQERRLAVMYPYGRAVFQEPLRSLYESFTQHIMTSMPLLPHESHEVKKMVPQSTRRALGKWGKRLLDQPYETMLRLYLIEASPETIQTALKDLRQLWGALRGGRMDPDVQLRVMTPSGNHMLNYL